jgi:hypothetical protein
MKQYVIDELRYPDYEKLKSHLDIHYQPGVLPEIYWVPIEPELLSDVQRRHVDCQPFYLALELEESRLTCELLVRSRQRLRCSCIGYATTAQRNWLLGVIDDTLDALEIKV